MVECLGIFSALSLPLEPVIIDNADFSELIDIMTHLRSPKGCPWDREQTHDSITGYILEETKDVLDDGGS